MITTLVARSYTSGSIMPRAMGVKKESSDTIFVPLRVSISPMKAELLHCISTEDMPLLTVKSSLYTAQELSNVLVENTLRVPEFTVISLPITPTCFPLKVKSPSSVTELPSDTNSPNLDRALVIW